MKSSLIETTINHIVTACIMENTMSSVDSLPGTPAPEVPVLTVSPADTSLNSPDVKTEEVKSEDKKPAKKRKSWGQELPVPKTNLPPR
jgi:transcriptional activator HAC1